MGIKGLCVREMCNVISDHQILKQLGECGSDVKICSGGVVCGVWSLQMCCVMKTKLNELGRDFSDVLWSSQTRRKHFKERRKGVDNLKDVTIALLRIVPLHVHGIASVGEVEATGLSSIVGTEAKGTVGSSRLGGTLVNVLLIIGEVLLNDVVSLHVDILVGVVLAVVDLVHATALLNEQSVAVKGLGTITSGLLVEVTNLENVLKAIKSNLDNLVVRADEKIAQRLNAALGNKVADLLRLLQTSRGSVADGPAGFLTGLQVTILKQVNQRWDDVGVDHSLDLRRVTSGNVGDGPASLLADTVLGRAEKRQKARQSTAVDDDLGLHIITSHDVTDGTQSGCLDRCGGVEEELDKSTRNASLDNCLNLLVRSIREVGDGPACIDEDLVIQRVDQLGENGESGGNLRKLLVLTDQGKAKSTKIKTHSVPVGLRSLATAEVAESPGGIAKHAKLAAITEQVEQGLEGTTAQDEVTAVGAVTSNVTERPDGLLANIGLRATQQLDEDGDSTGLNDNLGLGGGAGGNVGQGPSGLELDQSVR